MPGPSTQDDAERLQDAWSQLLTTLGPPGHAGTQTSPGGIPVTVVSGFLGAGKTTLLCRLLEHTTRPIAAIVNDLGAVNLDAPRISATGTNTIALENGCVCCALGDDLHAALAQVAEAAPEAIVIEASGAADPIGVAQTVAAAGQVALDGIVTVVDAEQLQATAASDAAALMRRQLEAAHLVLLNKTAANDVRGTAALLDTLALEAPGRTVLLADETPAGLLADIVLSSGTQGARPEPGPMVHDSGALRTAAITFDAPIDGDSFFASLDSIPGGVMRLKGFVSLSSGAGTTRYDIQAVGRRWRAEPVERVELAEMPAQDVLVVIGLLEQADARTFVQQLERLSP